MLVTGNGVVMMFMDDEDADGVRALFAALDALCPDTIEDTVADHALDTICFLQDEVLFTPIDEAVPTPWAITLTDLGL
jgi:hypothetical protein